MEKIITEAENPYSIVEKNEKLIANILHDIKSPLYSIKIGLQNKLDSELNCDIFETIVDLANYIDSFLINYSFKSGRFENKTSLVDVKELIKRKIENYKYVFLNKNVKVDVFSKEEKCSIETIPVFLSSITGNIISNIALHCAKDTTASVEISKESNFIFLKFKNSFNKTEPNFSMGLDFCKDLAALLKIELKFIKTKQEALTTLKIPML